jgi:hypothetical protein
MSDVDSPISETDPRDWTYIAEGGSTIVFSYDGPRNLHFDGTVVRLRKSLLSPAGVVPSASHEKDADDPTVDFQEHVISRLIPLEFLPHLEHVQIERGWLGRMVSQHDERRPGKRRAKDGIDVERTRAVLATDLIGSKGWAVEIKVAPTFTVLVQVSGLTVMMPSAEMGIQTQSRFPHTHLWSPEVARVQVLSEETRGS